MLGGLEAVCGSFLCAGVSSALASNKVIKEPFLFLGKHTLLLLCVHCLDGFWIHGWQLSSSSLIVSLARTAIDIIIMLILLAIKYCFAILIRRASALH